jgi:hypothetical protein
MGRKFGAINGELEETMGLVSVDSARDMVQVAVAMVAKVGSGLGGSEVRVVVQDDQIR